MLNDTIAFPSAISLAVMTLATERAYQLSLINATALCPLKLELLLKSFVFVGHVLGTA
jgi:hypothetical protein